MLELSMIAGMLSYSFPLLAVSKKSLGDAFLILCLVCAGIGVNVLTYFLLPGKEGVYVSVGFNFLFMISYVYLFAKWFKMIWTPLILGFLCLPLVPQDPIVGSDTLSSICLGIVLVYSLIYVPMNKSDHRRLFMIGALVYCLVQVPVLFLGRFLTIDEWKSIWWLMGVSTLVYNLINYFGVRLCLKTA